MLIPLRQSIWAGVVDLRIIVRRMRTVQHFRHPPESRIIRMRTTNGAHAAIGLTVKRFVLRKGDLQIAVRCCIFVYLSRCAYLAQRRIARTARHTDRKNAYRPGRIWAA